MLNRGRVTVAVAWILMAAARGQPNASTLEEMKISVDCSGQHGHVDITVPTPAVPCPDCNCPVQQCPACNCPAQQCPECSCRVQQCPACSTPTPLPPVKLATPTAGGYEFFPGLGHYKFYAYGATWQQGRQRCSDDGAHLVIVNSQREANVIVTLFTRYLTMPGAEQTGWAWTGVHEQGDNGHYVTLFGELLSTTGFANWSPKEPNDGGPNDCVLTNRINAHLADAACYRVFAFICELEL